MIDSGEVMSPGAVPYAARVRVQPCGNDPSDEGGVPMTVSLAPSAFERVVRPVDLCGSGTWLYVDGPRIAMGTYF